MRREYNELEREKVRRINAEPQVLQLQANQLVQERNKLYQSILGRANVTLKQGAQAQFYGDHLEVPDLSKPKEKKGK